LKIVDVNFEIKKKLIESKLLDEMSNLEFCDFLIIMEKNNEIIAASGIGGKLHVHTLIVKKEFRKKGIGKELLSATIDEVKNRKYSFITGSRNPENRGIVEVDNFFEFFPIFQVRYKKDFTREIIFLSLNKKGQFIRKSLSFFNSRLGTAILTISIKILKKTLFKKILTYSPEEFPEPDIIFSIKKFNKIKST